jgi:hypothetical protein
MAADPGLTLTVQALSLPSLFAPLPPPAAPVALEPPFPNAATTSASASASALLEGNDFWSGPGLRRWDDFMALAAEQDPALMHSSGGLF